MSKGYIGATTYKGYIGDVKMKKGYIGTTMIYSAGNVCTYIVNTGVTYQEEVDDGMTCLSPKTFTPSLYGWSFVGWREDKTASGSVLTNKLMGDNPITLYAVFRQAITLTKIANKSTTTSTGYKYYNNGNIANATLSISDPSVSGATFKGWSTNTSATVAYAPGTKSITLSGNTTIRAILKYNDITQSVARVYNTGEWIGPGTSLNNATQLSIDCSKYSGIKSTNCTARIKTNYDNYCVGWSVTVGGVSVTLMTHRRNDYSNTPADSGVKSTPYTINFTMTSGTTSLVFSHIEDPNGVFPSSTTGSAEIYAHTVTLTGRTIVG